MRSIILIAHNIRSTHNVGSLLRTADGLGIQKVYLTGYTPYPIKAGDSRLPHIANRLDAAISKTALGAQKSALWEQNDDIFTILTSLRNSEYSIFALEQTPDAIDITKFVPPEKCVLILGNELTGIEADVLKQTDIRLVIPMFGIKESFNVVQAAGMALYQFRFFNNR